jgi:hypothetical protein
MSIDRNRHEETQHPPVKLTQISATFPKKAQREALRLANCGDFSGKGPRWESIAPVLGQPNKPIEAVNLSFSRNARDMVYCVARRYPEFAEDAGYR